MSLSIDSRQSSTLVAASYGDLWGWLKIRVLIQSRFVQLPSHALRKLEMGSVRRIWGRDSSVGFRRRGGSGGGGDDYVQVQDWNKHGDDGNSETWDMLAGARALARALAKNYCCMDATRNCCDILLIQF